MVERLFQRATDRIRLESAVDDVYAGALQLSHVAVSAAVDKRLGEIVDVIEIDTISLELGSGILEAVSEGVGDVLFHVHIDVVESPARGRCPRQFLPGSPPSPQELPQAVVRAIASASASKVRPVIRMPLRVGALVCVLVTVLLLSILAWFQRRMPEVLKGAQTRTESGTAGDRMCWPAASDVERPSSVSAAKYLA